jgi:hypothetical protein
MSRPTLERMWKNYHKLHYVGISHKNQNTEEFTMISQKTDTKKIYIENGRLEIKINDKTSWRITFSHISNFQ